MFRSVRIPADRRGVILPLAAVCLVAVLTFAAMTIDLGFICLARGEAQNCADAAALAAALELYPPAKPQTALQLPISLPIYQPYRPQQNLAPCLTAVAAVAGVSDVGEQRGLTILDSDVKFRTYDGGVLVGPPSTIQTVDQLLDFLRLRTGDTTFVNACTVVVRRDSSANGPLTLFMAPFSGQPKHKMTAQATACIQRGYGLGYEDKMLPFALDITIWNAIRFTNGTVNAVTLKPLGVDLNSVTLSGLLGNNGLLSILNSLVPIALLGSPLHILDGFTWERGMTGVTRGADGIYEAVLLPDQLHSVLSPLGLLGQLVPIVQRIPGVVVSLETGASGGASPNAARLNGIIRDGFSASDLARLSNSSDGNLWLPFTMKGYFEVPTACEASLKAIIGQPRIIPLYATLPGTISKVADVLGASHNIQLVGWGAVVVTEVNLTGPVRYINIQPAIYARQTVQPATGDHAWRKNATLSDGVYTSPRLVK